MRAEAQSRWKDGRGCRNPGLTPHPLSSHLRARPLLPIHPQTQPSVLGPFLPCGLCPGHRALSCLGEPPSPVGPLPALPSSGVSACLACVC